MNKCTGGLQRRYLHQCDVYLTPEGLLESVGSLGLEPEKMSKLVWFQDLADVIVDAKQKAALLGELAENMPWRGNTHILR